MRKYKAVLFIVMLIFPLLANFKVSAAEDTSAIVKSFKAEMKRYFDSYATNKRFTTTELGGGWVNEIYEPKTDYQYDIQKTNSLISPYTAYCQFTMVRSYTDFHPTKDEAKNDNKYINTNEVQHTHYYAYQNGKWVVVKREHIGYNNDSNDCNEVIIEGNNAGEKDIFGCWELSMKYAGDN